MHLRGAMVVAAMGVMTVLAGCVAAAGETAQIATPTATEAPKPAPQPTTPAPAPIAVSRPAIPALKELTLARSSIAEAPRTITVEAAEIPERPTKILDPAMAERLFANTGATLQWIGWEKRGRTWVAVDDRGYWLVTGEQKGAQGERLSLEGFVTEIGPDYFLYDGTIKILGTPSRDRLCNVSKRGWRFEITQNRKYWRLREFEWCDRLTDYIDIYF